MNSLDLALIGNGAIGALIDAQGGVVWCCFPRFDGDPAFCSLLSGDNPQTANGTFSIELQGAERVEQEYLPDTPILVTRLHDGEGNSLEITDFCPRWEIVGGLFCPPVLVRQLRPLAGRPSVRVQVSPAMDYGCKQRHASPDTNRITYAGEPPLALSVNAPIEPIIDSIPFYVQDKVTLLFGGSAALSSLVTDSAVLDKTTKHWKAWRRNLQLPDEWTDAVIRAAITLELNAYEPTGAIIPAMTTSIPEAPSTGRTWDYRYCWPRDAYFTATALTRVGQFQSAERYLAFLFRIAEKSDSRLVPIYALDGAEIPAEHFAECLPGYRGMGPVRVGNKASEQAQHDLYGEAVLAADSLFPDSQRSHRGPTPRESLDEVMLARLEPFGNHAWGLHDKPDAGIWELRGVERVHTFSSLMCWVACDRLAKYAQRVGKKSRCDFWRDRAQQIRASISRRSWNAKLNAFTATMEGDTLDASLLLMPRLDFVSATDPRFVGTVEAIESQLKHGDFVYRYVERDDFGYPENAFLVCTFWYIEALAAMGGARREQARALFEKVLAARNRHGLLAEDLDTRTLEQWGNFPQTYSMAGIIDCAIALTKERALTTTG